MPEQLRAAGVAPAEIVRGSARPVDRLLDQFARYRVEIHGRSDGGPFDPP